MYLQHLICFIKYQDLDSRCVQHALAEPVPELAVSTNDNLLVDFLISAGTMFGITADIALLPNDR